MRTPPSAPAKPQRNLLAVTNLGAHAPFLASNFPATTTPSATHERPPNASKANKDPAPVSERVNRYVKWKRKR